jgi:hypothetical protein
MGELTGRDRDRRSIGLVLNRAYALPELERAFAERHVRIFVIKTWVGGVGGTSRWAEPLPLPEALEEFRRNERKMIDGRLANERERIIELLRRHYPNGVSLDDYMHSPELQMFARAIVERAGERQARLAALNGTRPVIYAVGMVGEVHELRAIGTATNAEGFVDLSPGRRWTPPMPPALRQAAEAHWRRQRDVARQGPDDSLYREALNILRRDYGIEAGR